ncbi:MAG: flippase-like domain-containing protein [Flavobacteriales bacterium]|nr:flippase-like domain-containing protein [Flavobacteriales bacterium]
MRRKQLRKAAAWLIKIAIVCLAFYYIYRQVFLKHDLDELTQAAEHSVGKHEWPYLITVLLMMLLNWGIEAVKWRYLVKKVETISFKRAVSAIFSGVTVSVFTPNKIGEYGGRVFHLKSEHRLDAVVITLIGSMMQLMVTLLAGVISSVFFYTCYFDSDDYLQDYFFYAALFVTVALIGLMAVAFFRRMLLKRAAHRIGLMNWARKYLRALTYYEGRELLRVLLYSVSRYFVFSGQLYLLLITFDVHISVTQALILLPMMFFMITVIPKPIAFAELGVRASTAIYFISYVSPNQLGVLLAMFFLWIINLAIPALLGSIFILRMKIISR